MIKILVDAALGLFSIIFDLCGDFNLTGLYNAYDTMFDILDVVCYFLPMGTISAIFSVILAILTMRLAIMTLKTLWDILPIL